MERSDFRKVRIRVSAEFVRGMTILLVEVAVRRCLIVNPVFFNVSHPITAGNFACRSRLVERTRTRPVAEGFGSVAALIRIPLINNDLDRHVASPHAVRTLFLVRLCCKPPMTPFAVNRQRRWNTAPRGRLCFLPNPACRDLQIANFIKFNCLKTRISKWQRIPGYGVTRLEMVFGMSAFPHAD